MLDNLVYLVFIICVALAAAGVVISAKLRSRYQHNLFSVLLYYQVFIYTFGFYGIWGQAAIKVFLSPYIDADNLDRFLDLLMLMGLPFLVFAWLMLIQFASDISGRSRPPWFTASFLLLNLSALILVGFFITKAGEARPASLIKYYFMGLNFAYSFIGFLLLLFPVKRVFLLHDHERKTIAGGILLIMALQFLLLTFYTSQLYLAMIFIFIFFAGNTFLPIYLNYGTLLSAFSGDQEKDISFEEFCDRYEVSPRETDIVREICNGLSNKEISQKLFISLQTVKDHTHRIYIKTNVRSRVQLINLVKDKVRRQQISRPVPPAPQGGLADRT
jgi:DNA-binding CsgD family transcriptional regulator